MMVVVMVVGVGHGVGPGQSSHRLLHVSIVWWGLHLQRSLCGISLLSVSSPMTPVYEVVTEESSVSLSI